MNAQREEVHTKTQRSSVLETIRNKPRETDIVHLLGTYYVPEENFGGELCPKEQG